MKRTADARVDLGEDIPDAEKLDKILNGTTKVKMFMVMDSAVGDVEKKLPERLKPVPGTMALHQIGLQHVNCAAGKIWVRNISCFCSPHCECHKPRAVDLLPTSGHFSTCQAAKTQDSMSSMPQATKAQQQELSISQPVMTHNSESSSPQAAKALQLQGEWCS